MAYEISNYAVKVTLVAGVDLSAKQYHFVKLDSSGQAVAVAAITDRPIGILQNAPLAGQEAEVLVVGGSKLKTGGNIAEGAVVGVTNTGAGKAIVAGTDTTQYILGTALTEATSGDINTVVIATPTAARAV